jgi:plastocyanin
MVKKLIALGIALAGLAASACAGGGGAGSGTVVLPSMNEDLVAYATLPKDTIGEELPGEGIGAIKSVKWEAMLGGYSQQQYAQSLGFPPGTKITIRNLSKTTTHTLDVVKAISAPPAAFPKDPNLPAQKQGDGKLEAGYASGPIGPGKTVTVTLAKAGTYLIGCAFHYSSGMHDVIVVSAHAAPGPQATPPPHATATPTSRSSWEP